MIKRTFIKVFVYIETTFKRINITIKENMNENFLDERIALLQQDIVIEYNCDVLHH